MSRRSLPLLAVVIIVIIGIAVRLLALDRIPAVTGDEAWYGVNAQQFMAGRAMFTHTGVGNPLNPIHSGPLILLSFFFAPSTTLLRAPEVVWGVLTVLLAPWLLSAPIGRRAAAIATTLLAVCPTAVAYSRLGWDPSGTPLIALLAMACVLRDQPLLAVLSMGLGLLVHPTNVFLAPILAASWAPFAMTRFHAAPAITRARVKTVAGVLLAISVPVAIWILRGIAQNSNTSLPSIAMVVSRVSSAGAWFDLANGFMGLLSGTTVARFIAGPVPQPWQALANGAAAAAMVLSLWIGRTTFFRRPQAVSLLIGMATSVIVFQAVAGPNAVQPGYERYALWALVPGLILCAMAFDALAHSAAIALTAVLALTMTAMLAGGYFYPLVSRGGESEATFHTGIVEPKLAAFQFVREHSQGAQVVSVIAGDWWLYWPLRYFAGADPRIHVELMKGAAAPGGLYPAGAAPTPYPHLADKNYAVVFEGSEAGGGLRSANRTVFTAFDRLQRPILHVILLPSAPE